MYHRGIPANDKPVELKTLLSLFWERPVIFQFHQIEDVNEGTQYFTCQGSDIALKGGNIMKSTFEEAKEYCLSQKSTAGFTKKVASKTIFFPKLKPFEDQNMVFNRRNNSVVRLVIGL